MSQHRPEALACPSCHQVDQVQKVSVVHESGISTNRYSAQTGGAAYSFGRGGGWTVGGAQTSGTARSQTTLSQRLAPPAQRTSTGIDNGCLAISCSGWMLLVLIAIAAMSGLSSLTHGGAGGVGGALVGIGAAAFLGLLFTRREFSVTRNTLRGIDTRRREALYKSWQSARERWQRLYYCHRCDQVFFPGETLSTPASQMESLLYQSDEHVLGTITPSKARSMEWEWWMDSVTTKEEHDFFRRTPQEFHAWRANLLRAFERDDAAARGEELLYSGDAAMLNDGHVTDGRLRIMNHNVIFLHYPFAKDSRLTRISLGDISAVSAPTPQQMDVVEKHNVHYRDYAVIHTLSGKDYVIATLPSGRDIAPVIRAASNEYKKNGPPPKTPAPTSAENPFLSRSVLEIKQRQAERRAELGIPMPPYQESTPTGEGEVSVSRQGESATPSPHTQEETDAAFRLRYQRVTVLQQPVIGSAAVGELGRGELFEVLEIIGDFYRVRLTSGVIGFVDARNLEEVRRPLE